MLLERSLANHPTPNKVWNFTSSVFMTVGVADTPWHPQFFSAATFESQRLTQDGTTIDPSHGLRLEEDPVAHFVILPIYQEDETLHRETLENLGRSPAAEKHMRMVLAMDRLVAATGHLLQGCDGQLSSAWWAFPTSLEATRCRPHWRELTSMFMTIGNADTLCHPQLFRPITFESQLTHFLDRPSVPVPFEKAFGLEGLIEENCMVAGVWVTAESCRMAEVVALSKFARWPRSYIDGRMSSRIRPVGGRTGAALFKFNEHHPQNREASSLKLLREMARPRPWTRSPGRPLPRSSSGRKSTDCSPESSQDSVWQPHTKVNTQKGKNGL